MTRTSRRGRFASGDRARSFFHRLPVQNALHELDSILLRQNTGPAHLLVLINAETVKLGWLLWVSWNGRDTCSR